MSRSPYWNPKNETMPRDDLRRLQLLKMRRLVDYAVERSPFHRRLFPIVKDGECADGRCLVSRSSAGSQSASFARDPWRIVQERDDGSRWRYF